MIAQVARWGNSLALRIPKALAIKAYNQRAGLCVVFPITSSRKGYPFEVALPGGLPVYGVVLADQCSTRSWVERGAKFKTLLP